MKASQSGARVLFGLGLVHLLVLHEGDLAPQFYS
jgi:hypothetical protein